MRDILKQTDVDAALSRELGPSSRIRRRVTAAVNQIVREGILDVLTEYYDNLIEAMRSDGAYITGYNERMTRLAGRVRGEHRIGQGNITVRYGPYLRAISSGTLGQGTPPIVPTNSTLGKYGLLEWVRRKGLKSAEYPTDRSLAWAIAKSIGRNGVQPGYYRERAAGGDDVPKQLQTQLEARLAVDLGPQWAILVSRFFTQKFDPYEIGRGL